jgi:hypothetical protein
VFHISYDGFGHVDAGGGFDPFEPGRRVDLENSWSTCGLNDVNATEPQLVDLGSFDGQIASLAVEPIWPGQSATMQVRSEISWRRLPHHGGDRSSADDDYADVLVMGLPNVLLNESVLLKVAQDTVDSACSWERPSQDNSSPLGAPPDFEDNWKTPDCGNRVFKLPWLAYDCCARHRHASPVQELHAEKLVPRPGYSDGGIDGPVTL